MRLEKRPKIIVRGIGPNGIHERLDLANSSLKISEVVIYD
jgi:hypothetical protein